jgi:hypothetical protein
MKEIIRFEANDGSMFHDVASCLAHESLCEEINLIMLRLKPRADSCFKNNETDFIQQDPTIFFDVRRDLLNIARSINDHEWFKQSIEDQTVHPSWAGRIIDEISRPLSKAWYRIYCTDKYCREWEQPYFANLVK